MVGHMNVAVLLHLQLAGVFRAECQKERSRCATQARKVCWACFRYRANSAGRPSFDSSVVYWIGALQVCRCSDSRRGPQDWWEHQISFVGVGSEFFFSFWMWRHFLQFHAVLQFDVYHFVYDQKQSSELPDEKSFKRPFDRLGVSLKLLYKHALEIKHMFFLRYK